MKPGTRAFDSTGSFDQIQVHTRYLKDIHQTEKAYLYRVRVFFVGEPMWRSSC